MAPTIVTSIDELYDLLDDAMEECPTGAHGRFLPMSALDDLITRDNVGAVLWPGGKLTDRDRQALDTVVQKCRKVFALLTIIGRHKAIQDLISEGMSDEHLPLSRPPGPKSNILYSAMSKAEFRTFSTQKKARYFVDEIILKQWWFMAPILDSHRKVWLGPQSIVEPGGKIHQKCPLPFLKSKDIRNTPGTVVYKVKLHRAHLRGFPAVEAGKHPTVAVKQFHKQEPFNTERENLEKTGMLKNPHLISHLALYQRDNSSCIIFPWAEGGDLRNFWEQRNRIERTAELTLWSLEQMRGIASALAVLHKDEVNGRHGDLKPDNILHFNSTDHKNGVLLIGDFGISKFHVEGTDVRGALITHSKATTPAYEAPEAALPQIKARSRKYDIWSLGCIYLEFVIWLLYGVEGINAFRRARKDAPHQAFYDLTNDARGEPSAMVHPIVTQAIKDLKLAAKTEEKNNDSDAPVNQAKQTSIGALVDLIENNLLLASWEERSSAEEVEGKLKNLVDNGNNRSSFLFRRDSVVETPELFRSDGSEIEDAAYMSTSDWTATAGNTKTGA